MDVILWTTCFLYKKHQYCKLFIIFIHKTYVYECWDTSITVPTSISVLFTSTQINIDLNSNASKIVTGKQLICSPSTQVGSGQFTIHKVSGPVSTESSPFVHSCDLEIRKQWLHKHSYGNTLLDGSCNT